MSMLEGLEEVVDEFLVESSEGLDQLDADLLALEQNPNDSEVIGSIFRAIHTIKGTSGFLGLLKLEAVAHVGESLLSTIRDGELAVTQDIISGLLSLTDALRTILTCVETRRDDGDDEYPALIERLTQLRLGNDSASETTNPGAPIAGAMRDPLGQVLVESGLITTDQLEGAVSRQRDGDNRKIGEILIEMGALEPEQLISAERRVSEATVVTSEPSGDDTTGPDAPTPSGAAQKLAGTASNDSVRVDLALLDSIVDLVGELVLARNQIVQSQAGETDRGVIAQTQHLSLIASEMQERVMRTRMQPIDRVWNKIPRVVRDLAILCGKQVRVEMEGQETELDRTLVEALKDPLTHLVRNAVDHGIETPEERIAAGKPAEAVLGMRAYHDGAEVIIEISDDGAGINLERVSAKALEKGLVTHEQLERMHHQDIVNLIFLPGFSTAASVTNVSGRGVGMDVVKTNIDKIRGTLDIDSTEGVGTTLRMAIPLTLAIIPALIVHSSNERFAIPQANVRELVRLEGGDNDAAIELVHGAPVLRLRGKLLPLANLASVLGLPSEPRESVAVVVLRNGDRTFGLVLDHVASAEEIVVKPLGKLLEHTAGFAGATIMGDGHVALILDVGSIAQLSRVGSEDRDVAAESVAARAAGIETQTFLTVRLEGRNAAIPFHRVLRLEQFDLAQIEQTSGQDVVQYDGGLLPIVGLASANLSTRDGESGARVNVVVCEERGSQFGLVVDAVLDIVEEEVEIQHGQRGGSSFDAAVIADRATDLVDPASFLLQHNTALFVHDEA